MPPSGEPIGTTTTVPSTSTTTITTTTSTKSASLKEMLKSSARPIPRVRSLEEREEEEHAPLLVLLLTYLGYVILIVFGHVRDFFGKRLRPKAYQHLREQDGYAPLFSDFDSFYTRRMYYRIRDCWNRPITGVPGRQLTMLERESKDYNLTFRLTGRQLTLLNLSSYNYLGFAQNEGECAEQVRASIRKYGTGQCSSRMDLGTLDIHVKLEELVARYLGKPAAIVTGMGFATNSTTLPVLVGKGALVISDALNHSSLVVGSRTSSASIRVFKHNDIADLEECLREAISQGQPRTHRPWTKILVVVEGLYSMEGNICNLPAIVALKKKYKFYLYVDEAHSIGALGPTGRGVCEHWGINPDDIDILMGTFTKSFGGAGGYIASSKEMIAHLRTHAHGSIYAETLAPAVCQQIISAMTIIMGEDGTDEGKRRIAQLAHNCSFMRKELKKLGFVIYGDDASPIIPLMLYNPAKIPAFSRECLKRGLAVVVVGYPATPIITSRVRFCLSAAHSHEDMEFALKQISDVGDLLQLKVRKSLSWL